MSVKRKKPLEENEGICPHLSQLHLSQSRTALCSNLIGGENGVALAMQSGLF
jgi:hypothetical protein